MITALLSAVALAATPDIASAAQGLQVSPAIINLNATKDATYLIKLTLTNVTAHELGVTGTVDDFTAKDETGTPSILTKLQESQESPDYSFASWTGPIGNLDLPAHASKTINVEVNVPAAAEAGGHYGVIRFSGHPPGESSQSIALNASIGSLVLVRVAGHIVEDLRVASFYVSKNNNQTSFIQTGPLEFVSRFQNDGNVHVEPTGLITVKNMLGRTIASLPISNSPGNVLPNSIRRFEQTLNKKWLFGHYTATLNATYGQSGKTVTASTSFWAIPYKLLLLILLILIVIVWLLRKAIKRYNQAIIKKHSSSSEPANTAQAPRNISTAKPVSKPSTKKRRSNKKSR